MTPHMVALGLHITLRDKGGGSRGLQNEIIGAAPARLCEYTAQRRVPSACAAYARFIILT